MECTGVCCVRQTDRHTQYVEPLVRETRTFEFEMTIEKLNSHRSLSTDQIPEEMINP